MKNLSLKILAAIITLVLYFFVNSQTNRTEITLTLPVEFKNLPAKKVILLPEKRQVQVTLRGPSHRVSALAASSLSFQVILPDNLGNQHRVNLSDSNLNITDSVEAYNINPATLDLVLDDLSSKEVAVEIPTIGKIDTNFKLAGIHSEPETVKITGPMTELVNINSVVTVPLDLRIVESSGEKFLDVESQFPYFTIEPNRVQVFFDVASVAQERKFDNLKIEVRSGSAMAYRISPDTVSVELSGPKSILKKLTQEELLPYVKIEQALSRPTKIIVNLDLPKQVSLIRTEPEQVLATPAAISMEKHHE